MRTTITSHKRKVMTTAGLVMLITGMTVTTTCGQELPQLPDNLLPVAVARDGHTVTESYRYRSMFSSDTVFNTKEGFRNFDENVYYNQHWEDVHVVNMVRRAGPVWELPYELDNKLGQIKMKTPAGMMPLDVLITDEMSRIQGFIVVHKGKIVYEKYPGMGENDNHIWYSTGKTLPAMILSILEARGEINVNDPVDKYLEKAKGTHWEGIRIIDVMDMASGLDLAETVDTMLNEDHKVNKYFRISIGWDKIARDGSSNSEYWTIDDLMYAIDDREDVAPGTIFEYSSLNTRMLTMLVEEVSGKRFTEILSDYVWSLIGAEGDGFIGVNPSGGAVVGGMMNSRLRDLARYGLLYTPSWEKRFGKAAHEKWGLTKKLSLADVVFKGCRPALYQAALDAGGGGFFVGSSDPEIRCNSRQWDSVYTDGDMYKAGVGGQGVYISSKRDLVVAFYSTAYADWEHLARTIAKYLGH